MRIAVVIERLDPGRGGAEVYTADFVRWLLGGGHSVAVVTAGWSEKWEAGCRGLPGALSFERVDRGGGHRSSRALRFAETAAARVRQLKSSGAVEVALDMGAGLGCDVVQPHAGIREVAVEGTLDSLEGEAASRFRRLLLRLDPGEKLKRALQARRYRAAPAPEVIAVSRLVADSVRRVHGVPAERVHVIHNGVNLQRFAPTRLDPLRGPARDGLRAGEAIIALTVAHNLRLKGAATVVALGKRMQERGLPFRFVLLGGGPAQSGPFQRMARRQGVRNVEFLGSTERVEDFYAAADVFLLPSFYDSCALTVFEAMASGLPVLTTARNGASEVLEHGVTGFVAPHARDVDAFAAALEQLADPDRRRAMGQSARRAAERLGCDQNFSAVLSVLRRIAERSSAAALPPDPALLAR